MSNYYVPSFQIEVNGSNLQADVSKNIQHLQVTSASDAIDKFSFTIANAMPEMRWTHTNDAYLFQPGSMVKVAMGYVDDMHDMMLGEITHVSPTFPEDGMATVTIEGLSLMHWLRGENKTRTFQKTNPKQIVQQIGKDAGLEVQAEDVPLQMDYVIQPNQSDLEFLKSIARSLHFEVLVQNKTLIFRPSQEASPKVFTFVWFGQQESFAPTPDTLPLKSFSPQMNVIEPATNVQIRSWDMLNKVAFVSNATSADQTSPMDGTRKAGDAVQSSLNRSRSVVHVTIPFNSQQEGDELAKSTYNAKAMGFVEGTAETIGVPELWSGQAVDLLGLGPIFDGRYLINEATHTIDGNGYNTSFTVKKNSLVKGNSN